MLLNSDVSGPAGGLVGTRSSSEAPSLERAVAQLAGSCLPRLPTPDHQRDPLFTHLFSPNPSFLNFLALEKSSSNK